MKNDLVHELNKISVMDTEQLLALWGVIFKEIPRNRRREYLIAEISYHLQVKAYGGISTTVKNKLERMAFGGQSQHQGKFTMQPGSRLVRDWNGKTHAVIVHADGYEYEGRRYRSLSKVATAITGAHWSGPLFFGLKKQKGSYEKAA